MVSDANPWVCIGLIGVWYVYLFVYVYVSVFPPPYDCRAPLDDTTTQNVSPHCP